MQIIYLGLLAPIDGRWRLVEGWGHYYKCKTKSSFRVFQTDIVGKQIYCFDLLFCTRSMHTSAAIAVQWTVVVVVVQREFKGAITPSSS